MTWGYVRYGTPEGSVGDKSRIEWTDATWNPIRGTKGMWHCTKVSPGCQFCYADGSVHQVNNTVAPDVYRSLGSIKGKETMELEF